MAPVAGLRETLYEEIRGRIQLTDVSVPTPIDDWFYYSRTEEELQFPIFARRQGSMDAPEEVLLDLNEMVGESGYIRLDEFNPSPDHRYLSYILNRTGGIEGILHVLDTETGETLPEEYEPVGGAVWASDSQTLFYVAQDEALRPFEVFRHTLGSDPATDVSVYVEEDDVYYAWPFRAKDGSYLFVGSYSYETSEEWYLPADEPEGEWTLFEPRREGIIYSLEHLDGDFLLLTDEDAPNFKLLAAPVSDPSPANRRELVPHREDVLLENVDPYAGYLVLWGREAGMPQIWVRENTTGGTQMLAYDEAVYDVWPADNRTFATTVFRFNYDSFATPHSVFEHDMATGARVLLDQQEVIGGHDPGQYVSERLFATAEDGTEVPVSLVRRLDMAEGVRPLLLEGYGAYGISSPVYFSTSRLSLLDRGVTFAIAHVRGGQELGRHWYEEGKLLNKKNTFTDFIACSEHLVDAGYTSADQLVAQGGSAGGLLMGAVANMRPDLYRAIIASVPFVDILRVMLDPSLPLTTGEYVEWGNPAEPEYYDYIASYDPYVNVTAQAYPNLLITGGIEDDQVPYWQPAKWTAKLRATATGDNLILLRMNMGAGHSGASARDPYFEELAHDMSFVLMMLDLAEVEPVPPAATPMATPAASGGRVPLAALRTHMMQRRQQRAVGARWHAPATDR
ncbi:MAG TPA: S9 family peptidase, partial [Thermomicrobiales bacterium]|nr:S9 family peptidase [Thermomicrobiales bacterium]